MSINTCVRSATLSDVESIATIHVACWREVYSFMPPELQAERGYDYRHNQWVRWFETRPSGEMVFSIVDGDTVVGFAVAKANKDPDFDVPGEFHACYILPQHRGGSAGPQAMKALAKFLVCEDLWPACVWAFRKNPYRRIYPALGCRAEVFRDRQIAGFSLPEIGYRAPDYQVLVERLNRMIASSARKQTQQLFRPPYRRSLPG